MPPAACSMPCALFAAAFVVCQNPCLHLMGGRGRGGQERRVLEGFRRSVFFIFLLLLHDVVAAWNLSVPHFIIGKSRALNVWQVMQNLLVVSHQRRRGAMQKEVAVNCRSSSSLYANNSISVAASALWRLPLVYLVLNIIRVLAITGESQHCRSL